MCSYEKPVNFNTDKMKYSATHFMTDLLSSRLEGQLDKTMYKAPVIMIPPCAYCLLSCVDQLASVLFQHPDWGIWPSY